MRQILVMLSIAGIVFGVIGFANNIRADAEAAKWALCSILWALTAGVNVLNARS